MWTTENRGRYNCDQWRHLSEVTKEEWAVITPLFRLRARGAASERAISGKCAMGCCIF